MSSVRVRAATYQETASMGFFSNLFKKVDKPQRQCSDAVLGNMQWSEDNESWVGELAGARFSLAYDGAASPQEVLLAYAREFRSVGG